MTRILLALGVVLLIATGVAGLTTLTIGSDRYDDSDVISCGSWFVRNDNDARDADDSTNFTNSMLGRDTAYPEGTAVQQCEDAISDRTPIVAVLGIAALAALIGAAITNNRRPAAPS